MAAQHSAPEESAVRCPAGRSPDSVVVSEETGAEKSIRTNPTSGAAEGDERIRTAVTAPGDDPAYELRLRACAGEIRHGVEMLRHWQGQQPATAAWLSHVERYAHRLSELVERGAVS